MRLLLIGCGKMGGALLSGWLSSPAVKAVTVVEPGDAPVPSDSRVRRVPSAEAAGTEKDAADAPYDMAILAVKPQAMAAVLPTVAPLLAPTTAVLSIAAGTPLATFEAAFGADRAIVRAMPNTPAAIGQGISVLVGNGATLPSHRALADTLMSAAGEVAWVEDEALIDPVTAVSGGGPAYVFLLIETLAKAGEASGLPADLSLRLARQTVIGAGALAAADEAPADRLRQNVTSPGGTTQAALSVLMAEDGVQPLFDRAIAAATRRGRELAG